MAQLNKESLNPTKDLNPGFEKVHRFMSAAERRFRNKRALAILAIAGAMGGGYALLHNRIDGFMNPQTTEKVHIQRVPVNIESSVSEGFQAVTTEEQNYSPKH